MEYLRINSLRSNLEKRNLCDERGFHRIEEKPETTDSTMVCYDCCLGFNQATALSLGINYRIKPKEKSG